MDLARSGGQGDLQPSSRQIRSCPEGDLRRSTETGDHALAPSRWRHHRRHWGVPRSAPGRFNRRHKNGGTLITRRVPNALHAQVQRLDRGIDKIAPEMKDLQREQDGSEIKSRELELVTDRVQNLGDRRDAFEAMRDLGVEGYRAETGDTWRPRNGSHSSQTGKLTSAAIDARDYLRASKDRETSSHLPEGTLVAFTGGKDFDDVTAIWRSLDSIKIKYDDMVRLHGGGPGAEKIAAMV